MNDLNQMNRVIDRLELEAVGNEVCNRHPKAPAKYFYSYKAIYGLTADQRNMYETAYKEDNGDILGKFSLLISRDIHRNARKWESLQ